MRILLTGMSSSQTSPKANERNLTFTGVLNKIFIDLGYDVSWLPADISWTAEHLDSTYDAVFVGVVPPTTVSANKAYGALSIIEQLWGSDKLKLVMDWPQQWLIEPSLRSVVSNPDSLTKSFYSKRDQYRDAVAQQERLVKACNLLLTSQWPVTLYPSLPWELETDVKKNAPSQAWDSLVGINYDAALVFSLPSPEKFDVRSEQWLVDMPSKWSDSVGMSLNHPVRKLKQTRATDDRDALIEMVNSTGLIVSPQNRQGNTWWSYSIVQAVATLTPVVTQWRESMSLGSSWSLLAPAIEELSVFDRTQIAAEQRYSYLNAIPTKTETLSYVKNLLS